MDKPLRLTANRFCGCSGWALAPFFVVFCLVLLFALVLRWRNASLAGGFAGRRVGGFLRLCVIYRFACPIGHDCPLYKYFFCLCSCKDRAFSATSATLEEKKQTKNKPKNRIGTRTEKASGGQQQQDGGRPGRQQG